MPKITFVGAGSVVFAQNLLGDILSYDELSDSTISLMDINKERAEKTATVAQRMIENEDMDATVESTTDRRKAIDSADYVINTIHVGGREPFENEIKIPQKYGVNQAVGDTIGPGGVFRAQRTIPIMLDIAHDMEELCPDALLLNYTNPMAMLCWAVDEATDVEIVGLCHSVPHTVEAISNYTSVPKEEIDYWVAGINHVAWFLTAEYNDKDLYSTLREVLMDETIYKQDNVRFEIMKHFGKFVTESSNHMSEYVPYFRTDEKTIEEFIVREKSDQYFVDWMETGEYFRHWVNYQREHADLNAEEMDISIDRSEEYGARIIHSLETDTPRRMNVNVRNDVAAITNLARDACVEVPCLVDGLGVHPCAIGDLPAQLAALNRSNIEVQRLAVKAGLEGDRDALFRAIKLDPLTAPACTLDEIDNMVAELLEANADYLPTELTN